MKPAILRVACIGPESTGKTTLSQELALHYKTVWVPEFSREYIRTLGRKYTAEDVIHCSKQQEKQEDLLLLQANRFLFSDTEEILAQIWLREVFQTDSIWLEQKIRERLFDFYLLTSPDLPFVPDKVRENPHRRQILFDIYRKELEIRKLPYAIIRGTGSDRLLSAISSIEEFSMKLT